MKRSGWGNKSAEQLAGWDPYDQNGVSPFFDPEWMFDVKNGFDVVIGNPPYVRADSPAIADLRKLIMKSNQYDTLWEKWDLMVPFFEKSLRILKDEGVNTFIASNSITTSKFAYKLQNWIIENFRVKSIDYFEDNMQIFEAGVVPVVTIFQKTKQKIITKKIYRADEFSNIHKIEAVDITDPKNLREKIFKKTFSDIFDHNIKTELFGNICYLSVGMVTNANEKVAQGEFSKKDLLSKTKDQIHCKEYVEGKNIKEYKIEKINFIEYNTERVPDRLRRPTFRQLYTGQKILRGRITKGTFDDTGIVCNDSIVVIKRFIDLKGVNQRSIWSSISKHNIEDKRSKTKTQVVNRRNELERISSDYSLKYLLAVINSKYAIAHLNNFRKHRLKNYFYPNDFRNFPISNLSQQKQNVFVFLVDVILLLNKVNRDTILFKSAIDGMVFNLYFPDHMKERKIDVLQFVEKDIEEVMQDNEFETLNDAQKEQVITELHNRWSDPDSEIVKRMNSFSEKSPEILKPILEG